MRHPLLSLVLCAVLDSAMAVNALGQTPAPVPPGSPQANVKQTARPCSDPAFRQFDFFVGDWDVYDAAEPSTVVARNTVTSVLDGCALLEVHKQTDGLHGESFSAYDAGRRVWHQSWFTNRGGVLLLDGGLQGDRMVLTGTDRAADGTSSLLRGTWSRDGDGVRQIAERSRDAGKTWTAAWDLRFRPHR
jgi:hypothetical protein